MNSKKIEAIRSSYNLEYITRPSSLRLEKPDTSTIRRPSKEIKGIFRGHKLKCTPQRLAVLSILQVSKKHLPITEIHIRTKRILPRTGLATIYRTLETLEKLGLVVRVHLENDCQSYAVAPNGHKHPIVCLECNRVVDFAMCPIEDISRGLSRKTGFMIQQHFLQLFGRCRECRAL